jgi:hypothetical protein
MGRRGCAPMMQLWISVCPPPSRYWLLFLSRRMPPNSMSKAQTQPVPQAGMRVTPTRRCGVKLLGTSSLMISITTAIPRVYTPSGRRRGNPAGFHQTSHCTLATWKRLSNMCVAAQRGRAAHVATARRSSLLEAVRAASDVNGGYLNHFPWHWQD